MLRAPLKTSEPEKARVMKITPEQSLLWLETVNVNNRNLRHSAIDRYAADMLAGNWALNGEAIIFDKNGNLINGQHRLWACVKAGVPFYAFVVNGVEPTAFQTIDSGVSRTTADAIRDLPYPATISAAVKIAFAYDNSSIRNVKELRATRTQEVEYTRDNADALVAAAKRVADSIKLIAPPSIGVFCHFVFGRQDPVLTERFFTDLIGGENINSSNPAFKLRDRLSKNRVSRSKLSRLHVIALFFLAWVAYRDGKVILRLPYWNHELQEFPSIEPTVRRGSSRP